MKPKSELVLYQTEDNRTRIEVRLENEIEAHGDFSVPMI
jgi:hypothetical protein